MVTANAESETLQLTLSVPPVVARHIRQQVSTGVYKSETDFVESLLLSNTLFEPIAESDLAHWIAVEGTRRCEAMDADPNHTLSHGEAWKFLDEDEDETEKHSS